MTVAGCAQTGDIARGVPPEPLTGTLDLWSFGHLWHRPLTWVAQLGCTRGDGPTTACISPRPGSRFLELTTVDGLGKDHTELFIRGVPEHDRLTATLWGGACALAVIQRTVPRKAGSRQWGNSHAAHRTHTAAGATLAQLWHCAGGNRRTFPHPLNAGQRAQTCGL